MPKLISAAAYLLLRYSGSINKVTGSRQYSRDLPQGRLDIPRQLTPDGSKKYIGKVKLLKLSDSDSDFQTVSVVADTAGGSSSKKKYGKSRRYKWELR